MVDGQTILHGKITVQPVKPSGLVCDTSASVTGYIYCTVGVARNSPNWEESFSSNWDRWDSSCDTLGEMTKGRICMPHVATGNTFKTRSAAVKYAPFNSWRAACSERNNHNIRNLSIAPAFRLYNLSSCKTVRSRGSSTRWSVQVSLSHYAPTFAVVFVDCAVDYLPLVLRRSQLVDTLLLTAVGFFLKGLFASEHLPGLGEKLSTNRLLWSAQR